MFFYPRNKLGAIFTIKNLKKKFFNLQNFKFNLKF